LTALNYLSISSPGLKACVCGFLVKLLIILSVSTFFKFGFNLNVLKRRLCNFIEFFESLFLVIIDFAIYASYSALFPFPMTKFSWSSLIYLREA